VAGSYGRVAGSRRDTSELLLALQSVCLARVLFAKVLDRAVHFGKEVPAACALGDRLQRGAIALVFCLILVRVLAMTLGCFLHWWFVDLFKSFLLVFLCSLLLLVFFLKVLLLYCQLPLLLLLFLLLQVLLLPNGVHIICLLFHYRCHHIVGNIDGRCDSVLFGYVLG